MLGVATKYCQSEKTIVVAFFMMRNSLINKLGTFNGFSKRTILTLLPVSVSF